MTNAQDWIEGTRFRLMSGHQEQLNRLGSAYTAGSGSMSFDFDIAYGIIFRNQTPFL